MHSQLILQLGRRETSKLLAEYGGHLVYLHYHYDKQRKKRDKTAELIIKETDRETPPIKLTAC